MTVRKKHGKCCQSSFPTENGKAYGKPPNPFLRIRWLYHVKEVVWFFLFFFQLFPLRAEIKGAVGRADKGVSFSVDMIILHVSLIATRTV